MSRDASGNYSLPAGNPVVTATTITVAWGNNTLNDIKQALTDSLDRQGRGGMLSNLDMNGSNIVNVGTITTSGATVTNGLLSLNKSGGNVIRFTDAGQPADKKVWDVRDGAAKFSVQARSDDLLSFNNAITISRNGIVATAIDTAVATFTQTGDFHVIGALFPFNSQSVNYTLALDDASRLLVHPNGAGAGDTFTIPANASVAFPVGTVIIIVNGDANTLAVAITTDTLVLGGTLTTGTRTLAADGVGILVKYATTSWVIFGAGVT